MIEVLAFILITVILLAVLGYHLIYVKYTMEKYSDFMKAIMAKDLRDYNESKVSEQPTMVADPSIVERMESDVIPLSELGDKEFENAIKEELRNLQGDVDDGV